MILFAVTGITLNHAADIEARAVTVETGMVLENDTLQTLQTGFEGEAPLPEAVAARLHDELGVRTGNRQAEWSDVDIYLSLPRPGGDGWLSIDVETGEVLLEQTHRGWIAFLNDLHKGRNTGTAWSWFIDIFAVACIVFCLTGLLLLQFHARGRPSTWPVVSLGLAAPLILILLFVH
ncbi:plasmolipin [Glycocaulis alkaliphilus]|uniref:Plasmolipin n=2 Tax=Glycocaulis alkaliphilus TaxID=1434191 RepID=A0A3T0EA21_9PROT|nr:plasmolipin [Glycocaulis alkaliphilus]GGB75379.1 membrane protein [Glycocaulis alkaliphilus]